MYSKLTAVIAESGLWNGSRKESHAFLLSPSVYQITEAQSQELSKLGFALYDCLLGLSHIAAIAYDKGLNYGGIWLYVRRMFSSGVPVVYEALQGMNIKHVPKLLKVDLMVDQKGNFKIAEIDGHNKHGLGYSTLGMRFREVVCPQAKALPGTVKTLATEVKRLGYSEIKLLYADQERFYVPEFEVVRQEFAKHEVNCVLISEMNARENILESGMFFDLPFLYRKKALYKTIVSAYKNGKVEFIIPPKPFLGAKGVLALLRNDEKNELLEMLLGTFIGKRSLAVVREYIPETFLVGKLAGKIGSIKERVSQKRYVLKESISSGMKGTIFSDDVCFESALAHACAAKMNWILQEEVVNQAQTFSWFENGVGASPEERTSDDWFIRVTVQYVKRLLGDVIVTACRNKAVHGGKECLQIGTVVL